MWREFVVASEIQVEKRRKRCGEEYSPEKKWREMQFRISSAMDNDMVRCFSPAWKEYKSNNTTGGAQLSRVRRLAHGPQGKCSRKLRRGVKKSLRRCIVFGSDFDELIITFLRPVTYSSLAEVCMLLFRSEFDLLKTTFLRAWCNTRLEQEYTMLRKSKFNHLHSYSKIGEESL